MFQLKNLQKQNFKIKKFILRKSQAMKLCKINMSLDDYNYNLLMGLLADGMCMYSLTAALDVCLIMNTAFFEPNKQAVGL